LIKGLTYRQAAKIIPEHSPISVITIRHVAWSRDHQISIKLLL